MKIVDVEARRILSGESARRHSTLGRYHQFRSEFVKNSSDRSTALCVEVAPGWAHRTAGETCEIHRCLDHRCVVEGTANPFQRRHQRLEPYQLIPVLTEGSLVHQKFWSR